MFRPNSDFAAEMQADPGFQTGFDELADDARRLADEFAAQAGAPWMPRAGRRQPIVLERQGSRLRLVNTDHAGHLQEWGGAKNPPHAPLRRGAQAAGLKLTES